MHSGYECILCSTRLGKERSFLQSSLSHQVIHSSNYTFGFSRFCKVFLFVFSHYKNHYALSSQDLDIEQLPLLRQTECSSPDLLTVMPAETNCYSKKPSPNCGTVTRSGVTKQDVEAILLWHNDIRKKIASGLVKEGAPGPQPSASNMQKMVLSLNFSPLLAFDFSYVLSLKKNWS